MKKIIIGLVGVGFFSVLLFSVRVAEARIEFFIYPDIKDDFCGVDIGFQYCKCAFHNEMCDSVNLNKRSAYEKVNADFQASIKTKIETFARTCMNGGGIYSILKTSCEYCENGKTRSNGVCADPKDVRPIEEVYNLPKVETTGGSNIVGYVSDAEGEFFVFSPGRGKWIGPVRGGLSLFQGDVLYTTINGRAQLRFGSANFYLMERSMLRLPTPAKERSLLERGALFIWESVKRLANNEPFDIEEGGAHSISGRKGTAYFIEVEEGGAKYTVQEGAIDVWFADKPNAKTEVSAGESAEAKASGVTASVYNWEALTKKYGLTTVDLSEPTEEVKPFAAIDPDAIYPPEAAYSGDLTGEAKGASGGSGIWTWIIVVVILGGGGFYFFRKKGMAKAG
ncbi:MAG: hypothetical protein Q7R86_01015 [bacterium]|nr:hypothetical protein [bacterium]